MNPYAHPDWTRFLEAIRANPEDDLARLIAADWLQEHGADKHAELIRLQCDLAKMPDSKRCQRVYDEAPYPHCRCLHCRPRRAEQKLLNYKTDWLNQMFHVGHERFSEYIRYCVENGDSIGPVSHTPEEFLANMDRVGRFDWLFKTHSMTLSRGFVEHIEIDESNWNEWREVIYAALPLRSVRVVCRGGTLIEYNLGRQL